MSELPNTPEKSTEIKVEESKGSIKEEIRKKWQLIAKILELICCALCVGLIVEPAKRTDLARIYLDHFALIFSTFSGYLLIISVFLVAKAIGDKIPYKTGFIISVLASCLFFISGILLAIDRKKQYLHDEFFYEPRPYILILLATSTALSFITSLLFGGEALFIWKFREDF